LSGFALERIESRAKRKEEVCETAVKEARQVSKILQVILATDRAMPKFMKDKTTSFEQQPKAH
jgi:hypothetical protein